MNMNKKNIKKPTTMNNKKSRKENPIDLDSFEEKEINGR
jgi:hypothetical protein